MDEDRAQDGEAQALPAQTGRPTTTKQKKMHIMTDIVPRIENCTKMSADRGVNGGEP
jgi:hypothetical protein